MAAREPRQLESVSGVVEEVIFSNEDTGFAVIELDSEGTLFSAVGEMPQICEGEEVTLQGYFTDHPSYGEQFKVVLCTRTLPSTAKAIEKYLSSGVIKGLGPKLARQMVAAFGDQTLSIIEREPKRLLEVKGITQKRLDSFLEQFRQVFGVQTLLLMLTPFGVSSGQAVSVYKAFGETAASLLRQNPYLICTPQFGIPFSVSEAMGQAYGVAPEDPSRLHAGICYVLAHNLQNGHTALPRERLLEAAAKLLGQPVYRLEEALEQALEIGTLCSCRIGRETISLPEYYSAEQYIARRVKDMVRRPCEAPKELEAQVEAVEREQSITYERLQKKAIFDCVRYRILILTGGPGTGKTTTLNGILEILSRQGESIALCAPTGRAAKRISEITGRDAKTIHRLLEVEFREENLSFRRNEKNPLKADTVVVDEMSMVDVLLFEALLRGVKPGARLILVGDYHQLPSVGAGSVLWDLLRQEKIPCVRLTQIFRQAAQSRIITGAHAVVAGEMPDLSREGAQDFFFLRQTNPQKALRLVVELAGLRLPRAYGYDPVEQIQVLCPQRKGAVGTIELNKQLQKLLNPPSPDKKEFVSLGTTYREHDKVMQVKNNYDIAWRRGEETGEGIFNGDIGRIQMVDAGSKTVAIDFDGRLAYYSFQMAGELELAYAITVHKSQGSEFDAVIMPVLGGYDKLYYRNLLYTAMTRAKERLVLVGDPARLRFMVENHERGARLTNLGRMLEETEG